MFTRALSVLVLMLILIPFVSFGNGGDQRVFGDEYLINLSRSPFTPIAGVRTAMTATFVDLQTGNPIQDDLLVTVRIEKGRGGQVTLREDQNILVSGGILDFSYTFEDPGLHEIYFDFAYAATPERRIEPPDFLIDVQPPEDAVRLGAFNVILIVSMVVAAFLIGFGIRKSN